MRSSCLMVSSSIIMRGSLRYFCRTAKQASRARVHQRLEPFCDVFELHGWRTYGGLRFCEAGTNPFT
jgi:hypothetical protein